MNKNVLKLLVSIITILSLFQLTSCNNSIKKNKKVSVDSTVMSIQRAYDDVNALINESDAIFIGKVISVEEPQMVDLNLLSENPDPTTPVEHIFTVSNIEVTEVLKGDLKTGDTVDVKQAGGTYKEKKQTFNNTKFYKIGDEYLFFTIHFVPSTPKQIEIIKREYYIPVNTDLGQIKIVNDKLILDNTDLTNFFSKQKNKTEIMKFTKETIQKNTDSKKE